MNRTLQELVGLDALQELMLFFSQAMGVPVGVQDNQQQWLTDITFLPICSDFHRKNPESLKLCRQNSKEVGENLTGSEYLCVTCPLGLEKIAFPIELNGSRLGVFYITQFLHAPADLELFRQQAKRYNFAENAYFQALQKVPILSHQRVEFLMQFVMRLINLLVQLGDENCRRKAAEFVCRQAQKDLEVKVEERTQELNNALNEVSDLVVQTNALYHQVETMAVTDSLTETYNRRKFDEVAVFEQQQVQSGKLPFSVIMLDIDRFKQVNDRFGHSVGDQVLKQLCVVIRGLVRQGDKLIRWGGEEFLIVLPATQLDEAAPLAQRIRQEVREHNFAGVGQITISLGVTQLGQTDSIDRLVQRVDQALYRAKQKGRDRVELEPGAAPLAISSES